MGGHHVRIFRGWSVICGGVVAVSVLAAVMSGLLSTRQLSSDGESITHTAAVAEL